MTKAKFLSAALIAAAMLATPAMAREGPNPRHLAMDSNASAASGARSAGERGCHPAPAVGAFATQPWDNAPPCEPASVY